MTEIDWMPGRILKAAPHKWGLGKVHLLQQAQEKTLCGIPLGQIVGEQHEGLVGQITCDRCLRVVQTGERRIQQEAEWVERQKEREVENQKWWNEYTAYLNSPEWKARRSLVLKRAKNICEGCLLASAVQVHHTTYEHVRNELLFELVALCTSCHNRAHDGKDSPT